MLRIRGARVARRFSRRRLLHCCSVIGTEMLDRVSVLGDGCTFSGVYQRILGTSVSYMLYMVVCLWDGFRASDFGGHSWGSGARA